MYRDTAGKIRKINGAVPWFRAVPQLSSVPEPKTLCTDTEASDYGEVEYLDESFWNFDSVDALNTDQANSNLSTQREEFCEAAVDLNGSDAENSNPPTQEKASSCYECFNAVE